jgi:hypothetical protein
MKLNGLMWLAAGVLLLPGVGRAERHVFPLAETQVIVGPESEGRVLLDFDSMDALREVIVTSAFLEVPLPSSVREQDLEVSVYALGRAWRGRGATWTSPWTRAGGDLDESYFHEVTIRAGQNAGTLRLNVTQVVDEIVTEGTPSYGLVLTTPLRRGDGFTVAQRSHLGTMAGSRLVVTTANARAAEPQRGG